MLNLSKLRKFKDFQEKSPGNLKIIVKINCLLDVEKSSFQRAQKPPVDMGRRSSFLKWGKSWKIRGFLTKIWSQISKNQGLAQDFSGDFSG